MKNRRLVNFIWMATAAGWRRSDIVGLAATLQELSPIELDQLISNARQKQDEYGDLFVESRDEVIRSRSSVSGSSDIDEKVLRLLRVDAGLSVIESVHSMARGLRKIDRARAADLPAYSKQSLGQWVRRAAEIFSPSELLYVATMIRNASVHGVQLDWGLRKNDP